MYVCMPQCKYCDIGLSNLKQIKGNWYARSLQIKYRTFILTRNDTISCQIYPTPLNSVCTLHLGHVKILKLIGLLSYFTVIYISTTENKCLP